MKFNFAYRKGILYRYHLNHNNILYVLHIVRVNNPHDKDYNKLQYRLSFADVNTHKILNDIVRNEVMSTHKEIKSMCIQHIKNR